MTTNFLTWRSWNVLMSTSNKRRIGTKTVFMRKNVKLFPLTAPLSFCNWAEYFKSDRASNDFPLNIIYHQETFINIPAELFKFAGASLNLISILQSRWEILHLIHILQEDQHLSPYFGLRRTVEICGNWKKELRWFDLRQRDEESRHLSMSSQSCLHWRQKRCNRFDSGFRGNRRKNEMFSPVSNKLREFGCEARMEEVEGGQRGEGNEGGWENWTKTKKKKWQEVREAIAPKCFT